jgi:fibronectin-binding autotransporter adhesin
MIRPRVWVAGIALFLAVGRTAADDNAWTGATNFNWSTVSGNNNWALSPLYWGNNFIDGAFFNGVATGTITATTPITLRGMSFNANGYTIAGTAANALTLTAGSTGSLQNGEIQVANAVTDTVNGVLAGSVGLTKTGSGTLLLGGANTYSGDTNVNAGTLAVTLSGAVIPSGGNVTVASGATFNYGNGVTQSNSMGPVGTLTLNNGTYRLSGGSGDFYLNKLVIGATGGSVDMTGSTDYFTHFTGAGAGITVNSDSNWIGANTSHIENDTGSLLPFTLNSSVTSSVVFSAGTGGFRLLGGGVTLFLNSPTAMNSADFRVEVAYLRVNDMAALGTGAITLAGAPISAGSVDTTARLHYSGPTGSSSKNLTLDASGGDIYVSTAGTALTLNGVISETGGIGRALTIYGDNITGAGVVLTAANTYTGPTAVNFAGILSIPSIANGGVASPIGASSNSPANLILGGGGSFGGTGTLTYTGPSATTDRGVTLGSAGGTINTATIPFGFSGQFTGPGGLTFTGGGRLTLTNTTNNYAGGTTVLNGYVVTPDVACLGSGSLTLSGTPLGTTFESSARWQYYGSTAATSRPTILGSTGGDIWVSTTGTTLTLTGLISETGGTGRALTVYGDNFTGSTLALTAANTYTGPTVINYAGILSIPTIANGGVASPLGAASNSVTNIQLGGGFFGGTGTLRYTGPNASTDRGVTLETTSYTTAIDVATATTVLTMNGVIAGPGALTKLGAGTLALANSFNGFSALNINAGTIQIASESYLGFPVPPINFTAAGTLQYSASIPTSRTFNLNQGSLSVTAGQTLTLNGAAVNGGFMHGPGAFAVTGGTTLSGITTTINAIINETGVGTFADVTNGGALTVAAGLPASYSTFASFTNQGSGSITVSASSQVNAADFQTYGVLTLSPGTTANPTQLTNTGTTPLFFNGGSRTSISIPANGNPNQFDAGIDLHGQNTVVAGGLFVNNGYVVDSVGAGTKTVIADFGSLVKGAGFYQNSVQTINGGKFQSGNSPGQASFGSFTFGPGGVSNYVFAIDDATGTAGPSPDASGHVSGWGLVKTVQRSVGGTATTGDFAWNATPANQLTVALDTLLNPTTVGTDVAGPMADFDPTKPYSWPAVQWTGSYSGPADAAALNAATAFDTTGFANPIAGSFGWSLDAGGHSLSLTYTPSAVPEPGTLSLVTVAAIGWMTFRRRHRRDHARYRGFTAMTAARRRSILGDGP